MIRFPSLSIPIEHKPGTAVDPPPPPLPPLELRLQLASATLVPELPFEPGKELPHHFGRAAGTLRGACGVQLTLLSNWPRDARIGAAEFTERTEEARAAFAAVREQFAGHELYLAWKRTAARLADLRARTADVEAAPQRALDKARALMIRGGNPEPAEAEFEAAEREKKLHANRLAATADAERTARTAAEAELARRLDAARAQLEQRFRAEANELAARVNEIAPLLADLIGAHVACGRLSASPSVAVSFGAGGDRLDEPFRQLT